MDKRTIYSKTGKGSLEISKKTIKLAGDERQTLILVDGKSNVGEIEDKLARVQPVRLRAIFDKLAELDLIREFVTKQGPDSIMPNLGGPTAMRVEEIGEEDLDFTALAPAASGDTIKELEARRLAAEQAEEQARAAREDQERKNVDAARLKRIQEEAEAKVRAEFDARRKVEEEAAARQRAEEEARRKVEEEARRKVEAEARRKAEEEARQKAEAEARRKAEEDARRRAEEEARRKVEEEARRKAEEEARRKAEAEARRKAEEDARRREESERIEREAAEQRAREDFERRARAQAEQREREEIEARQRAEADALLREQTDRRAREEGETRERARREEEAKRAAIIEEKRRLEDERRRLEEEQRQLAEEHRRLEQARQHGSGDAERRVAAEADRYTAALTPHLDQAAPSDPDSLDLDFNAGSPGRQSSESVDLKPLRGGGPDTFADTGMSANSVFESDLSEEAKSKKDVEKQSRRELEREAKENAKAAAKAKKAAEQEAKRLARDSKVRVRRGSFGLGKLIGILLVLLIAGGVGYLYFMPIDKALVESTATARLGAQVQVGTVKFEPFPPQLKLTNVVVDGIVLPSVTAVPDPASLAADHKIWNSIDIAGLTLDSRQAERLIALASQEPPKGTNMSIQRIRASGVTVTGLAVPLPPLDATVLLGPNGIKQATAALTDGKAQVLISPDDKGWLIDFESRGITWAIGPKVPWESVRAKGVANASGIKFDSIAITQFGGSANGAGEMSWTNGWKFAGNMEVGGMESGSIAQAFYAATPVSGTVDGKFKVTMSAATLPRVIESTGLEGSLLVNKPVINNLDLARSAQAGAYAGGQTRFADFTADLVLAAGKLQIKNIRGNSGLLTVTGGVDVNADKTLGGSLNVDLGVSSNRTKSVVKFSGTPAEPKVTVTGLPVN